MIALDSAIFWTASAVAIISTLMVLISKNPFNAVLYLILSLFGVSLIFYTLGAPFLAALEIIVYAGAIMVLFLFVVQMLSPGSTPAASPDLKAPTVMQLLVPSLLALALLGGITMALFRAGSLTAGTDTNVVTAKMLGTALFKHHYLGVELASLILLIGIVGGMHLGRAASVTEEDESVAVR